MTAVINAAVSIRSAATAITANGVDDVNAAGALRAAEEILNGGLLKHKAEKKYRKWLDTTAKNAKYDVDAGNFAKLSVYMAATAVHHESVSKERFAVARGLIHIKNGFRDEFMRTMTSQPAVAA